MRTAEQIGTDIANTILALHGMKSLNAVNWNSVDWTDYHTKVLELDRKLFLLNKEREEYVTNPDGDLTR